MKKIIVLVAVFLMVSSVAFAQGRFSDTDISNLKGTWSGTLTFTEINVSVKCDLEIINNIIPLYGKLLVYDIPDRLANQMGVMTGTNLFENPSGYLTNKGTVMWAGNNSFFEIWPFGSGRVQGWFYFRSLKGDLDFRKK